MLNSFFPLHPSLPPTPATQLCFITIQMQVNLYIQYVRLNDKWADQHLLQIRKYILTFLSTAVVLCTNYLIFVAEAQCFL